MNITLSTEQIAALKLALQSPGVIVPMPHDQVFADLAAQWEQHASQKFAVASRCSAEEAFSIRLIEREAWAYVDCARELRKALASRASGPSTTL